MVLNGDLRLFYFTLPVIKANSEDPDHTLRSAVSDLCLQCLPTSKMSQSGFYRCCSSVIIDNDQS